MLRTPVLKEGIIPDVSGLSPLLKSLLSIDTRKDSPDIKNSIKLIKDYCIENGLHYSITGPKNGPESIVIKINGIDSNGEGLVLLAHIDTADWNLNNWKVHPLSAIKKDGKIYGRGAIDCKSLTAIWLELMKYIRMTNPVRDIVLIITTDEETGGESGLKWITENTEILKGFSSALNEGGGYIMPSSSNRTAITCQYGEKGRIVYPLEPVDNEIEVIIRDAGLKGAFRHLQALGRYYSNSKMFKGCRTKPDFKNSFFNSITILNNRAEVSYLPKTDPEEIICSLKRKKYIQRAGEEAGVKLAAPGISSLRTRLFRIIREETINIGWNIVPVITRGYSDSRYLRGLGIDTYGFFPLGSREDINCIHGLNEHIHEESLHESFRILFRVVYQYSTL